MNCNQEREFSYSYRFLYLSESRANESQEFVKNLKCKNISGLKHQITKLDEELAQIDKDIWKFEINHAIERLMVCLNNEIFNPDKYPSHYYIKLQSILSLNEEKESLNYIHTYSDFNGLMYTRKIIEELLDSYWNLAFLPTETIGLQQAKGFQVQEWGTLSEVSQEYQTNSYLIPSYALIDSLLNLKSKSADEELLNHCILLEFVKSKKATYMINYDYGG